jgi:death on curing protein
MNKIIYFTEEKLIELNALILVFIKVKKADKLGILSYTKIINILDNCKNYDGDLYDKAVILIKNIIKQHAFASGNRRTAFIATKQFILQNKGKFNIKGNNHPNIMQGIREDFYSNNEIKEWIKYGKIRKFKR